MAISLPYVIEGGLAIDDRGCVAFANDFDFKNVKRFYMVENHERGFIRAFHGHQHESKYVYVVSGVALFGLIPLDESEPLKKFVLSSISPKILYIPEGYYNGFQTLQENTKILFFSTSTLQDSLNDDIREKYDKWNIWEKNFR